MGLALAHGAYALDVRAGIAVATWWAVVLMLLSRAWPRARVPRLGAAAAVCLAVLAVLAGLSTFWSGDAGRSIGECAGTAGYLGIFALVLVAAPAGSARTWLTGLAVGLTAVAALALASRILPSAFPHSQLGRFIPNAASRLSYPVGYWNGLAACLAMAAVLSAWLSAAAERRPTRAAATAALPLVGLALYLTSSRGGVVALAAGLVALIVVSRSRVALVCGLALGGAATIALVALAEKRAAFVDGRGPEAAGQGHEMLLAVAIACALAGAVRWAIDRFVTDLRLPRALALATTVAAVAVAAVAIAASHPGDRVQRLTRAPATAEQGARTGFVGRHLASADGTGRWQFWQSGWRAFKAEPVRGIGAGGYQAWWRRDGSLDYYIRDAHSLYAETLAELGLLGFAALVGFLALSAAAGLLALPDRVAAPAAAGGLAVLACGAVSAGLDWTWELPAAFAPVVVAAGVLAGPALAAGRIQPRGGAVRALPIVAGVAALAVATLVLVTQTRLADSREAVRAGDLGAALKAARGARSAQPWAAAPHLQAALVEERMGLSGPARASIDAAAERAPESSSVWLVAARIRVRSGDVPGARAALRNLRRLDPRSGAFARTPPGG